MTTGSGLRAILGTLLAAALCAACASEPSTRNLEVTHDGLERVANPDAMANPEVLAWYATYAGSLARQSSAHGEPAPALESWRS